MDLSRATRLMARLTEVDQSSGVSRLINNLRQRMDQLVSSPTDPNAQTAVVQAAGELREALALANSQFSPEELANANELVRLEVFNPRIVDEFEQTLAANVATPAVARDQIGTIEQTRSAKLAVMQTLITNSKDLGWGQDEEETDWDAEVGFKIPRELFANEFDRLIGEFRFLKRFLSNIAEIEGQSISDVQLASLSTTDPLIVLGVAVVIAERVGKITKWALDCWKTVEEIRKLRAETSKLKSFTEEEVESIFGNKIRAEIDTAIAAKAKELAAGVKDKGRKNELENSFSMHLKEFMGRIERGMTVEIRLLCAPQEDEAEADKAAAEFEEVAASLTFPPPSSDPVLQITQQDGG